MSNSALVQYTKILPHKNSPRNQPITKITIHHMAGVCSLEDFANIANSRTESANYAIDKDGRIGLFCDEADRSWCSSSSWNDNRAVTIEVSNSKNGGDWPVSDNVMARLIDLCVDICQRNGIKELKYTGDKEGSLTIHSMFAATACPGPYLKERLNSICDSVNREIKMEATAPNNSKLPIDEIAKLVIRGNYGNGEERKQKLTEAGYNYSEVQAKVDELMSANKKSIDEIARLVIRGDYGNGAERKNKLNAEGYRYDEVQKRVDEILAAEAEKVDGSTISSTKLAVAHSYDINLSGTYVVIPNSVNLRSVPGNMTTASVITTVATKTKVRNYGYYEQVGDTKWLLVVANGITGFIDMSTVRKV